MSAASESKLHGNAVKVEFRKIRDRALRSLASETKTKRQVIAILARAFDKLLHAYLRSSNTTYAGWLEFGPRDEMDEVLGAAADESVWDRFVEKRSSSQDAA